MSSFGVYCETHFGEKFSFFMESSMSNNKSNRFPHINQQEQSARPGVEGARYVSAPGMPYLLGDTNTGLLIYPRDDEHLVFVDHGDDTQLRDAIEIVSA